MSVLILEDNRQILKVLEKPMDPQVAAKVDAGCAEDLDVSELSAIAQKIEDIQK